MSDHAWVQTTHPHPVRTAEVMPPRPPEATGPRPDPGTVPSPGFRPDHRGERRARRSPWRRPWPWTARAACAALACHLAAVVVNCTAGGGIDIGAGGGFTVGSLLVGADAVVLVTVLVRAERRAPAEDTRERER
ncbi:hypothetical protein ABZ370_06655 [Streptomyces sp. NPDC005962]|uniref:hypothetical protein n=1 Tax=Streptomyces sp. NPDC005962 TaxID=3154466 RepID=UPI003402C7C6